MLMPSAAWWSTFLQRQLPQHQTMMMLGQLFTKVTPALLTRMIARPELCPLLLFMWLNTVAQKQPFDLRILNLDVEGQAKGC